jgi:hypothetical protein
VTEPANTGLGTTQVGVIALRTGAPSVTENLSAVEGGDPGFATVTSYCPMASDPGTSPFTKAWVGPA